MPKLNYAKVQTFEGSSMQSLNYPEKTRCPRRKCEDSNVSTIRRLKLIMRRLVKKKYAKVEIDHAKIQIYELCEDNFRS